MYSQKEEPMAGQTKGNEKRRKNREESYQYYLVGFPVFQQENAKDGV